ncbi:Smr/MutS family protein [Halodesulfovibrio spirochaetisodalis]|nr:Smr/MutS family protein [Halodesulfovibrio spirochaetisodalis]
MDNNPFKGLNKKNFPDSSAQKKKKPESKKRTVQDEDLFSVPSDDEDLFSHAMSNVSSLGGGQGKVKKRTHSSDNAVRMDEVKGFDKVAKKKDKKQAAKERSKKAVSSAKPKVELSEEDAFAAAMMGVSELSSKGREVVPDAQVQVKPRTAADDPVKALQDLLDGEVEFKLEYTDEYIQGHVEGVDPITLGKLRAGQYSPEGHLDMHGMVAQEAHEALVQFLRASYNKGKRTVLLIPGRGKNSPEGYAVLRERIQEWLTRDPFKRVVLAFCTAQNKDGGAGALYVMLRKYKKNRGKIQWQRNDVTIDY